jgi:hypothetical protein
MVNNVYGDDELNCSDEPTAVRETKTTIEIVMPDVKMSDATPHILQEDDSVSTFRSKRSVAKPSSKKNFHAGSIPSTQTPITFATSLDDGSVSKLSESTSRLLAFEDKFNEITNDLQMRSEQQEKVQLANNARRHRDTSAT